MVAYQAINSFLKSLMIKFHGVKVISRAILFFFLFSPSFVVGQGIVINEFLSANENGLTDEDGDFEDWIELYNAGSQTINLLDYGLSDEVEVRMARAT